MPGADWPDKLKSVLLKVRKLEFQNFSTKTISFASCFLTQRVKNIPRTSSYFQVAPPGLDLVTTMMCGSCSNENAYKMMFMNYMKNQRGGEEFSQEDMDSCMMNKPPGAPKLSILSFKGANTIDK